jgi:hypothetical protein
LQSILQSRNGEAENYVLVTESPQLQVTDVFQKKRDDDMLWGDIVSLGINVTGYFPSLHANAPSSRAIQRDAKDFSVVKTRPAPKPLNERLRPGEVVDCSELIFGQDGSPFDGDGDSVAAAEAEGGDATLQIAALQFIEERH